MLLGLSWPHRTFAISDDTDEEVADNGFFLKINWNQEIMVAQPKQTQLS